MAYGYRGSGFNVATSATTVGVALSASNVTGDMNHVCVLVDAIGTPNVSIADTLTPPTTYNPIAALTVSLGGTLKQYVFDALNIVGSGANTITATADATCDIIAIAPNAWSGIATSSALITPVAPNVQAVPGTGTDAVTSGNTNATSQPALSLGFSMNILGGVAAAAGTGYTDRATGWDLGGGNIARLIDKRLTATGNNAATFTASVGTDVYATYQAVYLEAVADVLMPQICM